MERRLIESSNDVFAEDEVLSFILDETGVSYSSIGEAVVGLGASTVGLAMAIWSAPLIASSILAGVSIGIGIDTLTGLIRDNQVQSELESIANEMDSSNYLMVTTHVYEVYYSGGNHVNWTTEHSYAKI